MSEYWDWMKKHEKVENHAVNAFVAALIKQRDSFEKGEFTRRSWAKIGEFGYDVKLGRLEQTYTFADKEGVMECFSKTLAAASTDRTLIGAIEAADAKAADERKKAKAKKEKAKVE